MIIGNVINIDKEILGGTPVFNGTRVPIQSLFWHLEKGISIDEFLDDFPSVQKQQVYDLLHLVALTFDSNQTAKMYEAVA